MFHFGIYALQLYFTEGTGIYMQIDGIMYSRLNK